jgi:hypothetical protein
MVFENLTHYSQNYISTEKKFMAIQTVFSIFYKTFGSKVNFHITAMAYGKIFK